VAKKKKNRNLKNKKEKKFFLSFLPEETKRWILGALMFLGSVIVALGFFDKAGIVGEILKDRLFFLMGRGAFLVPFIFALSAFWCFVSEPEDAPKKVSLKLIGLGTFILILGLCGFLGIFKETLRYGGWFGYIISRPFLKFFGVLASQIIFLTSFFLSLLIFRQILSPLEKKASEVRPLDEIQGKVKEPLIKKFFTPRFRITKVEPEIREAPAPPPLSKEISSSEKELEKEVFDRRSEFKPFPVALLEGDKGRPDSGNIKENSLIVKKTLENFGIEVVMGEVNIGPTVTQYTLRPGEGVKLSRITGLSNNLALALAAHPIRIEAPIPGKSLVGIEVPNKTRTRVRLKTLVGYLEFSGSSSSFDFILGRDVSGGPVLANLARLPHLLVAGSTGSGKTIFLNSLILSLLYQNGPDTLRFILIDPKRVEFPIYNGIPHLLCPVILNVSQTVNVLKWLIGEMERRFDVLSEFKMRDINFYNLHLLKEHPDSLKPMPYIVVIIDELADLMAARGRDVEAGIVRLAQMARAVGIHLVVATQRPSVDIITGLIKANIVARVSFQVASQVDSRTVLDMAGAEKLLGWGDMLYICAEITRPKRIQGAYVSEKEIKKVIKYIRSEAEKKGLEVLEEEEGLKQALEESLGPERDFKWGYEKDSLYEEAKQVVILAGKASASLLQRKLQVGYPRAARLIDALEEEGVIGPQDGTKPREVYVKRDYDIGQEEEGQF